MIFSVTVNNSSNNNISTETPRSQDQTSQSCTTGSTSSLFFKESVSQSVSLSHALV